MDTFQPTETNSGFYSMYFIIRSIFLFGLVFWFSSIIPQEPLDMRVRGSISLIVVIVYSLVDAIRNFINDTKNTACQMICKK